MLPQLDVLTYNSTTTVVFFSFLGLVFVLYNYIVPKLAQTLKTRSLIVKKQTEEDIILSVVLDENIIVLNMAKNLQEQKHKIQIPVQDGDNDDDDNDEGRKGDPAYDALKHFHDFYLRSYEQEHQDMLRLGDNDDHVENENKDPIEYNDDHVENENKDPIEYNDDDDNDEGRKGDPAYDVLMQEHYGNQWHYDRGKGAVKDIYRKIIDVMHKTDERHEQTYKNLVMSAVSYMNPVDRRHMTNIMSSPDYVGYDLLYDPKKESLVYLSSFHEALELVNGLIEPKKPHLDEIVKYYKKCKEINSHEKPKLRKKVYLLLDDVFKDAKITAGKKKNICHALMNIFKAYTLQYSVKYTLNDGILLLKNIMSTRNLYDLFRAGIIMRHVRTLRKVNEQKFMYQIVTEHLFNELNTQLKDIMASINVQEQLLNPVLKEYRLRLINKTNARIKYYNKMYNKWMPEMRIYEEDIQARPLNDFDYSWINPHSLMMDSAFYQIDKNINDFIEKKGNMGLLNKTTFVIVVLSYLLLKPETISITSFLIILYSIIKIFRRQIICFFRGLIITRRKGIRRIVKNLVNSEYFQNDSNNHQTNGIIHTGGSLFFGETPSLNSAVLLEKNNDITNNSSRGIFGGLQKQLNDELCNLNVHMYNTGNRKSIKDYTKHDKKYDKNAL